MHAAVDGVYHVQLQGTIPTCTYIHYSKKCFARPAAGGSEGSVPVIDGDLFIFTVLIPIMQCLRISLIYNCLSWHVYVFLKITPSWEYTQ